MMNYHVLYNPLAGNGDSKATLDKLSALLDGSLSTHDITKITDYKEFFAPLGEDDAVVLSGGDGTINRFINDTEDVEINCDILYFPSGSGNDFLRDVGRTVDCPPFSIKNYIKDLPVVEVNGKAHRFINNVGFGIDGYCCEVGDEQKKVSVKPVNYTSIAIKGLLFHYKPCSATVTVDGKEYKYKKVWLAPAMKGRFYGGGMMPTPEQDRNDPSGDISILVFHGSGKLKTLMVFPSLFKGEHVKHEKIVSIHKGQEISVTFDRPAAVQIDGETIKGVKSYRAYSKIPVKSTPSL